MTFLYPFSQKIFLPQVVAIENSFFISPLKKKFILSIGSHREWQKTATFSYLFLLLNRKQKICPAKISSQVVATEKAQKGQ